MVFLGMEKGDAQIVENDFVRMFSDSRGSYVVNKIRGEGELPKIAVYSDSLPGAWELSMISIWGYGARVGTHYDSQDDTPKSKEATVMINVSNPLNEPIMHKNYPGGPVELESYVMEVVDGIHDGEIVPGTPKWTYTYHERLFNYNPSVDLNASDRGLLLGKGINQMDLIIKDLERDITSKGAQATTWMPSADPLLESNRPCLQRDWFRPLEDGDGGYLLNQNTHWRSRDDAKAWLMNARAFIRLQERMADTLSHKIDKRVMVGSYCDISDSLHIYGDYFKEFEGHFEQMQTDEKFEKRVSMTGTVYRENFDAATNEARENLIRNPDHYMRGGK